MRDLGTEEVVLDLRRHFRFIFHKLDVHGPTGELLGSIERRWSWLRRIYHIESESGHVVAELFGPIFRPWTFEIRLEAEAAGRGLGRVPAAMSPRAAVVRFRSRAARAN